MSAPEQRSAPPTPPRVPSTSVRLQGCDPFCDDGAVGACPRCPTEIPENARFCGVCGETMTAGQTLGTASQSRFCGRCGAGLPDEADFCGACGAKAQPETRSAPPHEISQPSRAQAAARILRRPRRLRGGAFGGGRRPHRRRRWRRRRRRRPRCAATQRRPAATRQRDDPEPAQEHDAKSGADHDSVHPRPHPVTAQPGLPVGGIDLAPNAAVSGPIGPPRDETTPLGFGPFTPPGTVDGAKGGWRVPGDTTGDEIASQRTRSR